MREAITPLVITFNEAPNIGRTLAKLRWAKRVVVIDSGSTDATLPTLRTMQSVNVFHRDFDTFADQCNFGLEKIDTEWVLSIDADYEVSDGLAGEMSGLQAVPDINGYQARFVYRINGRSLRGGLYPPRIILFRVAAGRYVNEGHGHVLQLPGRVGNLHGVVYHDDRKPLGRWFESQKRYAAIEAEHLLRLPSGRLSATDRIRRWGWPAPLLVFFYVLVVKGGALDGWAGWFYALQRMFAETMIALEILDRRMAGTSPSAEQIPAGDELPRQASDPS